MTEPKLGGLVANRGYSGITCRTHEQDTVGYQFILQNLWDGTPFQGSYVVGVPLCPECIRIVAGAAEAWARADQETPDSGPTGELEREDETRETLDKL